MEKVVQNCPTFPGETFATLILSSIPFQALKLRLYEYKSVNIGVHYDKENGGR